jgi:hypothetical protein
MNVLLVVALNVGLAAVVYLLLLRRIDRKLQPERVIDTIRSEIEGIIVELNQTTDRNIGLIEDRVNQLGGLLEQADRRLAVLKRELESRTQSTERYNDILSRARATSRTQTEKPSEKPPQQAERSGDRTALGTGNSSAPESTEATGEGSEDGGRAARRREILDLHKKGIAANIIANRTGTTVGEVELIISLNERKA